MGEAAQWWFTPGGGAGKARRGLAGEPAGCYAPRRRGDATTPEGSVRYDGHAPARFRQIGLDYAAQHHDALEFSNGTIVLLTELVPGQKAIVLQLPAIPADAVPDTVQPRVREVAET